MPPLQLVAPDWGSHDFGVALLQRDGDVKGGRLVDLHAHTVAIRVNAMGKKH